LNDCVHPTETFLEEVTIILMAKEYKYLDELLDNVNNDSLIHIELDLYKNMYENSN